MTKSRKSHVAIAVAAASLAGAGAAVAESSHTHSGGLSHGLHAGGPGGMHDDLSVAATYLGLTESELQTRLRSGKSLAEVANATDGKSADGLVDVLVAAAQKNIAADVSSGRLTQAQADGILPGLKQHITDRINSTGSPGGPHGRGLEAAATYLGLSESALQTQLQSGKTLGEIADATAGKSRAELIAALVADETANIEARVTDLVNGKLPPP